jgi:Tfp pilus assembly protein PilV
MKQEQLSQMQKEWQITNKGFLLIEVLLSSALFILLVTTLMGAYLYGEQSTALSGNRARAVMFAEEGFEATRNIRDAGFANLANGIHGLSIVSNVWNFSGTSDTNGIYTRNVTIGSIDSQHKIATSTVTWQQNGQLTGQIILTTRFTDWQRLALSQANKLLVSFASTRVNPSDNTQIIGIVLGNSDTTNVVISSMAVSWSGGRSGTKINGITIGGTSVWSGSSNSGVTLNITDTTILGNATSTPINIIDFNKNMTGASIFIRFNMSDGSATTTTTTAL